MKKIVSLLLCIAIVMSFSIYALAYSWYTPYTGAYTLNQGQLYVTNLKCTQSSIDLIASNASARNKSIYWEFEARDFTENGVKSSPQSYYSSANTLNSNLPSAYKEFDPDDISIGCNRAENLSASTSYYGSLTLTSKKTPNFKYNSESEWGTWFSLILWADGVPLGSEYIKGASSNAPYTTYSW